MDKYCSSVHKDVEYAIRCVDMKKDERQREHIKGLIMPDYIIEAIEAEGIDVLDFIKSGYERHGYHVISVEKKADLLSGPIEVLEQYNQLLDEEVRPALLELAEEHRRQRINAISPVNAPRGDEGPRNELIPEMDKLAVQAK